MIAAIAAQGFDLCAHASARRAPVEIVARAAARAAAAGVSLRQPRDDESRRADSAPPGQRADGADHRRKRNRQRARRARDPRGLAAKLGGLPSLQLHDDNPRPGRQSALRSSARQLHRRGQRSARAWSARPPAARSFSTRSATCRSTCSRSCCASSSRGRSCRSATRGLSAWTSA